VYTMDTCSVVISRQSHSPILQFNSPCNEFMSVWSMFVYKCLVNVCIQAYMWNRVNITWVTCFMKILETSHQGNRWQSMREILHYPIEYEKEHSG